MPMAPGANQGALSRKHIIGGVDASLQRLGHDYVDVLAIHRHPHAVPGQAAVPIEEMVVEQHPISDQPSLRVPESLRVRNLAPRQRYAFRLEACS